MNKHNMERNPNAPRPRMNSPMYEDGPWLKEPIRPDMFRNMQLGIPGDTATSLATLPPQRNSRGGRNRALPEPLPSIASVHQANKHPDTIPNTQYDEVGVPNRSTGKRSKGK
jgi:hypothetical protein